MELEKIDYLAIGLFILILGITVHGFLNLEGDIAIHFNADGDPDNTMAKLPGLLLLPALSVFVYFMIMYIPRIDPLKENVEEFRPALKGLAIFSSGFLAYVQGIVVAWNLGYIFNIKLAVVPGVAAMFYAIGLICERAERNWFIGLRTPWTLSSDKVWEKTHRKAAQLFKFAAVFALGGLLFPEQVMVFIVLPAVLASVFAMVYSFLAYRDLEE